MEVKEALIPSSIHGNFLLRIFNVHVPPGKRVFRHHRHVEFEIVLFKSGKGTYSMLNKSYDIKAGDIFLFSSNEVHCITNIEKVDEMVLMNVHFEPRFIWSAGNDMFDAKYLKIFLARNEYFENRLDRENPASSSIRNLLLDMEKEFYEQPAEYALMAKTQLLTILVNLIRHFNYVNSDTEDQFVRKHNFVMIENSINFINQNLKEYLTLELLANKANMSRAYYSTVFKKLNGISPWDYITSKRIELSMEYLKNDTGTMLQIAGLCGVNNTANFNRAFKKYTNQTPSEYKAKNLPPEY